MDCDMKLCQCPECEGHKTFGNVMLDIDDIKRLAVAILSDNPQRYEPDCGPPQYFCEHCEGVLRGWKIKKEDFRHEENCPVIIAKRLLI